LKVFRQAEAQMHPLPKDESKPIVDWKSFDRDLLVMWLAVVKPWPRGDLAKYIMQPDRDPVQDAQLEHVWLSREQASGGRGIGGGGCGCN
jgi:hypothetical protein